MSIFSMDDRLHSGGTIGAAFQALRSVPAELEVNKVKAGFMHSPHDAGFHILILEINVSNKRSALQVKRSLSAALAAPLYGIVFSNKTTHNLGDNH